jgi:hypothetical protein
MNFDNYYNARSKIIEIMEKDLLGPLAEDEIICDERPLDYYIIGKIYPRMSNADELIKMSTDDVGELDEEDNISLCNGYNPSSFSISFSVNNNISSFTISAKAASYSIIERETARKKLNFQEEAYKKNAKFWQRNPIKIPSISINIGELIKGKNKKELVKTESGDILLSINILYHKIYPDGSKTITVSMVNHQTMNKGSRESYIEESIKSFFQPEIRIISDEKKSFCDIRRNIHLSEDPEIQELNMLYSRVRDYASGHGCAVDWETDKDGDAVILKTEFLPTYNLKLMMSTEKYKDSMFLQMKYLANGNPEEIIDELKNLIHDYSKWISRQRKTIPDNLGASPETAERNLGRCEETATLLLKSIELLKDETVFKAFSLANLAMFEQRKKGLQNTNKYTNDENIAWYPFQLAFFLKEIYSIVKTKSKERELVDLLWFPTGGGKTEAYLGIAAFTIFYRRLKYGDGGNGVTVLMRYTLRLLSFQQFERAAALICACEIIRKKEKLGGGEIGIGLWVGQALTPNKIDDAVKILNGEKAADEEIGTPIQFKKCPWCGSELTEKNYSCDVFNKRMLIKCSDTLCNFQSGLPVYLIDEEIYKYTPSFIVGTIDKFAQLALNEQTANIFGIDLNKKPPELIIQDELHLISGPLGTITGLYEAAIRKLCENDGIFPKIIASTATIRNADEQIKHLYSAGFTQFPPQGTNIDDTFFSVISTEEKRPARLYLGCMAIGTSPTTMMIRVMSSLLFATRFLAYQGYDEKIIDSFWTITAYFNTLRELGGAIVRVIDDIQDRFGYLKKTKFSNLYPLTKGQSRFDNYKELTSRVKGEDIGNIMNKLTESFRLDGSTRPYDFLLCSNMISVGVDIARLGTMIVVGQPKTSSEYIQATSRVGRETPGLVITTYNQSKSRDRSHYEKFTQYHGSFYKFVEATSVTPFSVRARDRALQALFVILCRYLIPQLKSDSDAVNFRRSIPGLKIIREYIKNYVKQVDPDECLDLENDLSEIEAEWERKALKCSEKLKYRRTKYSKPDETLFEPDYNESSRFRVLNSMRSVETMVNVIVKDKEKKYATPD